MNRTRSLYLEAAVLADIAAEAKRIDRTESWVVQRAWRLARKRLRAMPSAEEVSK